MYEPTNAEVTIAPSGPYNTLKKFTSVLGAAVNLDDPQAISGTNGNKIANNRGNLVLLFKNDDDTDNCIITPHMSAAVVEAGQSISVIEPEITVGPGEAVFVGPFSRNYEFGAGMLYFTYVLEGSLTAADVSVEPFLLR